MIIEDQPVPSPDTHAPGRRGRRRSLLVGAAATGLAAAAALTTVGVANAAPTAPAASSAAAISAVPAAQLHRCDDGPWKVADASVEGAPAGFAAGDIGRTYLWHDGGGWHLRTTDARPGPHHYSGTITTSPGAKFADVDKVRLEPGNVLFVDNHQVLHYAFTTFDAIDGVNFRVTACDGVRNHEQLIFSVQKNSHGDDPALIDLGEHRTHPGTDPFTAHRSV